MKEKKENSLQEMIDTEISVNETQSKFYKIFYDNIYTYVIMNTYLELLFTQESEVKQTILDLVKKRVLTYPKNIKIKDIKDDKNIPSLMIRLLLGSIKEINIETLKHYNFRNMIQYLYTEFEFYLFKCLKYIYTQKRMDIIEEKQVKIKLLLKHQLNLNTIIQAKIDKIIEQKLRENYSIFFRKSIHEQLGLKHSLTENEINSLIEFKLLRDLYAHGDGTVTQIYLDKVPNSKVNLGDKLNLTLELIIESYTTVIKILNKFDSALIEVYPDLISAD